VLDWLEGRGPNYAQALADRSAIRVAVNHAFARPDDPVGDADEIAVFPPVTGG
jgi:molybdopterin converting factor small subunit